MMKKIVAISLLLGFFIPVALSQNVVHADGCHFLKRVEYNLIAKGGKFKDFTFHDCYNLQSKGEVEKLFFGDFNARTEFFYAPSFEGASGFRIVRDSLRKSYILEVKYISNYREASNEADKEARKECNLIDIPIKLLDSLPRDIFNMVFDYNKSIRNKKYSELLPKLYKVETLSVAISDRFAEKLFQTVNSFIDNFKAKGVPPTILDGYSVTFRTVVDDEVWSLYIHEPQGNALRMANLYQRIIKDTIANELNEAEYIKMLDF